MVSAGKISVTNWVPWDLFTVLSYPLIAWAIIDFCLESITGGILTTIVAVTAFHCLISKDTWNLILFFPVSLIAFVVFCIELGSEFTAISSFHAEDSDNRGIVFLCQTIWQGLILIYTCGWLGGAAFAVRPFCAGLGRRKAIFHYATFWELHACLTMAFLLISLVQIGTDNMLAGVPCLLVAITGLLMWLVSILYRQPRPRMLSNLLELTLALSAAICAALAIAKLEQAKKDPNGTQWDLSVANIQIVKYSVLRELSAENLQTVTYCELILLCFMLTLQTAMLLVSVSAGYREAIPWDRMAVTCEIRLAKDAATGLDCWKFKRDPPTQKQLKNQAKARDRDIQEHAKSPASSSYAFATNYDSPINEPIEASPNTASRKSLPHQQETKRDWQDINLQQNEECYSEVLEEDDPAPSASYSGDEESREAVSPIYVSPPRKPHVTQRACCPLAQRTAGEAILFDRNKYEPVYSYFTDSNEQIVGRLPTLLGTLEREMTTDAHPDGGWSDRAITPQHTHFPSTMPWSRGGTSSPREYDLGGRRCNWS